MIDVIVAAVPGSNVSKAEIVVKTSSFSANFIVSSGMITKSSLVVPASSNPLMNFEFSVRSDGKDISAYAENIPNDASILILGTDALRFDAQIYHGHVKNNPKTPTCVLMCSDTSIPMNGPGCRECNKNGLVFKICC